MERGRLPFAHLNLVVADLDRSCAFYREWFGFDGPSTTYPDGTVFLRNADRFDLALHPGELPDGAPRSVHVGFRPDDPGTVRRLRAELEAAGVARTEQHDEPGYVGFKCLDPDGYEIEVYWQPPAGA